MNLHEQVHVRKVKKVNKAEAWRISCMAKATWYSLLKAHEIVGTIQALSKEDSLLYVTGFPKPERGCSGWKTHLHKDMELILVGLISAYSRNQMPLDEEGLTDIAYKFAVKKREADQKKGLIKYAVDDKTGETVRVGRRKHDGIVCGHHWYMDFLKRHPYVKTYKATCMSNMRANKATAEVC